MLGGVSVRLLPGTRQVITSNGTAATHSVVALWRSRGGDWTQVLVTRSGRTGYGGLVPGSDRERGTGTTPLGTYQITETFGNAPRPRGTALPFHGVRQGDYWVQDNRSAFYKQRRHIRRGGLRPGTSEHLPDYGGQYAWSLVIDFNRPRPVKRRGSGIFLHVNGDGATAGCVRAARPFIESTMKRLRPRLRPLVSIGR